MIDGMNGLAGFTILSINTCFIIILVSIEKNIFEFSEIIILEILMISFLIFNFPFGRIFLGDAGAYWLGWLTGILAINIFNQYNLSTWTAVLILIYPVTEVIFSTFRKIIAKKNPLYPDRKHLHLKIYLVIKGNSIRGSVFNSFTTLCLMPIWISPVLGISLLFIHEKINMVFTLAIIAIYLIYYYLIPYSKVNKTNF